MAEHCIMPLELTRYSNCG